MLLLLFVLLIPCVLDSFGFKNETNDYFFYGDWVHLGDFPSVSYRETEDNNVKKGLLAAHFCYRPDISL